MKDEFGALAAGTLGYIHGNVPGAIAGYNAFKLTRKLGNMAPIKRRRSSVSDGRSAYLTPKSTRGARRKSMSGSTTAPRRTINFKRGETVYVAPSATGTYSKSRKSMKKKVKVSRKLRDKIKKVIANKAIIGKFQETAWGGIRVAATISNKQNVGYVGLLGSDIDPLFSPARVLDAASCLWNEKAFNQTVKTLGDVRNFDAKKIKVRIVSSSMTYNMRNNSQRTYLMKVVECSPKSNQVAGDPIGIWAASLGFQAAGQGPNQNSIDVNEIHTLPTMLPDFQRLFNTKVTNLTLLPGQSHTHRVDGPKDVLYDFQKFWNGATPNTVKHAKHVFFIVMDDLVTTTLGGYGRYVSAFGPATYGIVFEGVSRYTLEMPEQVGFIQPVAVPGNPEPLGQRQFSYAIKSYPITGALGLVTRIEAEDPNNPENDPQ